MVLELWIHQKDLCSWTYGGMKVGFIGVIRFESSTETGN